jgi:hypothetical protein
MRAAVLDAWTARRIAGLDCWCGEPIQHSGWPVCADRAVPAAGGAYVAPQEVLDGFTAVVLGGWVEQAAESLRHAHDDDPDLVPLALVEQVEAIVLTCKDRLWPLVERLHAASAVAGSPASSNEAAGSLAGACPCPPFSCECDDGPSPASGESGESRG